MRFIFFLTAFSACFFSFAQKKIINHEAYAEWNRMSQNIISNDGAYSAYTIRPLNGDGLLYLVHLQTGKVDSFPRGVNPQFSSDSKSLVFKITAGYDTLRQCELNKVKKKKRPTDSLGIYLIESDSLIKIARLKSFTIAEEGNKLAYMSLDNKAPKRPDTSVSKKKKKKKKKRKKKKKSKGPVKKKVKSDGKLLVVTNSDFSQALEIKNVSSFKFSESGTKLAYITHQKTSVDSSELIVLEFGEKNEELLRAKFPAIAKHQFDESEKQMALVVSMDTVEKNKVFQLQHADLQLSKMTVLVDTLASEMSTDQSVSKNKTPYFSVDGKRIYFGIGEKPKQEAKDTLLDSEKAKLDLWHWKDNRLQPQQLLSVKRDMRKSNLSVYDIAAHAFVIIENDSLKVRHNSDNPSEYVLGYDKTPYEHTYNWDYPYKTDVYRVNVNSGARELLEKGIRYGVQLSPKGDYYTYFSQQDSQVYLVEIGLKAKPQCITCLVKDDWLVDLNGMPMPARSYGIIGWMRPDAGKKESEVLVQSKYDIYKFNLDENKLVQLTNVGVRKREIKFSPEEWSRDSIYFNFENSYITGFNERDKSSYIYKPTWKSDRLELEQIHHSNHTVRGIKKAKSANVILYRPSSLKDYPDAYSRIWDKNAKSKRISNTNPQQSDYNWATVELTSWKSYAGDSLNGLLYKPENYDPTKKYPLLVYFYEMYSDDIHNHYAPRPTASIIYPTEYASAGYMVLIPDIRYKAGYPAQGAYDCIMSGTDHILKNYPNVDSTKMGLQGQSWGGYQTAQLVTMTKRYKAAMAGAPVSNMFSAYGGIRWGSGLNRQFQYERTQSRIGKTIWESPELYVENSPLFHLPKVTTPLMIMHNDGDGAVPWYQGIELFVGLKRLGKPAWLLNYNGDQHNLRKPANKMDLSIRMRQFFDYYLRDQVAPVWLLKGIPATEKGKEYRLEESK